MAVLIPNLNKPSGCFSCPCSKAMAGIGIICGISPGLSFDGWESVWKYVVARHPECPLIEVAVEIDEAKLCEVHESSEEIVDKFNSIGNPNIYESKGEDK